jgi:hypothetical protein
MMFLVYVLCAIFTCAVIVCIFLSKDCPRNTKTLGRVYVLCIPFYLAAVNIYSTSTFGPLLLPTTGSHFFPDIILSPVDDTASDKDKAIFPSDWNSTEEALAVLRSIVKQVKENHFKK